MKKKQFNDVQVGEMVYFFEPQGKKIRETKVVSIEPQGNYMGKPMIKLGIRKAFGLASITEEKLAVAESIGVKNVNFYCLLDATYHTVLLATKLPVVLSTTKKELKQWLIQKSAI